MTSKVGDIAKARDIGKAGSKQYIWAECPSCHFQRWTAIKGSDRGVNRQCQACVRASAKQSFKVGQAK